ncbi:hypothetical protein AOC23_06070 [Polynucleobacter paneuropaeus]|jgi:hypothetical protein|uniref:hypothetical protein n=1 Tax=Polynucleobacter paneuropaeus TaxID=2527775 RepID=UPI001BFCF9F6|nr:hypothetical protein [Polynucleobacter paneuropaeus]MBT8631636.1 hypothetical protein [Polynucleobacter paneuropaeus]
MTNTKKAYLLIDMKSGAMDGVYNSDTELAVAYEGIKWTYPNGEWIAVEVIDPPANLTLRDNLFHVFKIGSSGNSERGAKARAVTRFYENQPNRASGNYD